MFEYLHLDMIPIIFSYLSQHELLNILFTNKFIYYQIMKYINTTKFILIDSDDKLRYGCENNLIISIVKIINMNLDWNCGLYYACKGGHINITKLIIKKGANDCNRGLAGACEGCNESLVKLMIEKGANNWNRGLYYACEGGDESIVKLMIDKGANHWEIALYCACESGHESLVKLMIEKGANDLNVGLKYACKNGHINIVKLMIEKGATQCRWCNKNANEH